MTKQSAEDKLKAIEEQWNQETDCIDNESFEWLIARVKKLTEALDDIELCGINEQSEIKNIISKARGDE